MTRDKKNIFIAIPTRELNSFSINGRLSKLLSALERQSHYNVTVRFYAGQPVELARNNLVHLFLATECDYLLMIDDDIVPPEDILEMAEHGKDVVAALCYAYSPAMGIFPVAYEFAENGSYRNKYNVIGVGAEAENKGLLKVGLAGSGCIMIHRRVFSKIEEPYFKFSFNDAITDVVESEDFGFCTRVIEAGMDVYVDTDRACGHFKHVDLHEILKSTTRQVKQRSQQKLKKSLRDLCRK